MPGAIVVQIHYQSIETDGSDRPFSSLLFGLCVRGTAICNVWNYSYLTVDQVVVGSTPITHPWNEKEPVDIQTLSMFTDLRFCVLYLLFRFSRPIYFRINPAAHRPKQKNLGDIVEADQQYGECAGCLEC